MIQVKFFYNGITIPIQCNKNEKLKEICNRLETKIEKNSVYYLYKGNEINKELKLEEIIEKNDDINNINILVNNEGEDEDEINKNNLIKSKFIKCPECKENIKIKINDYKIKLYDCKNGHIIDNIWLNSWIITFRLILY